MSSILTNTSAMSALQSLTATQKSLSQTQNQISSGLRVSDASDNAAYWSIATTMRSDTGALSAVSDALSLGSSTLGVATAALNSTLTIMNKMKADLVTAATPGTDPTQIQTDISALQQSLKSITSSAAFNGVNLLNGTASNTNIVASFSRGTNGATSIGTISVNTATTTLTATTASLGILSKAIGTQTITTNGSSTSAVLSSSSTGTSGTNGDTTTFASGSILGFALTSSTTTTDLAVLSAGIDAAIKSITTAGATLGGAKTNVDNQSNFVSSLSDAITSGVGSLVDADMNVASTRLQALQTQQQLGIQSLSIANQNSQMIMRLFS